jgi:hypothetical protein
MADDIRLVNDGLPYAMPGRAIVTVFGDPFRYGRPGDYEKKGEQGYEGLCACCGKRVTPNDPSVVLYSYDGLRGGLFFSAHAPTGPQWYGIGEGE